MSVFVVVIVVVVSAAVFGFLGFWWWVSKVPIDRRDAVSNSWWDEHVRDRRDGSED